MARRSSRTHLEIGRSLVFCYAPRTRKHVVLLFESFSVCISLHNQISARTDTLLKYKLPNEKVISAQREVKKKFEYHMETHEVNIMDQGTCRQSVKIIL